MLWRNQLVASMTDGLWVLKWESAGQSIRPRWRPLNMLAAWLRITHFQFPLLFRSKSRGLFNLKRSFRLNRTRLVLTVLVAGFHFSDAESGNGGKLNKRGGHWHCNIICLQDDRDPHKFLQCSRKWMGIQDPWYQLALSTFLLAFGSMFHPPPRWGDI